MQNDTPIYYAMRTELINSMYEKSRPMTKWEQVKSFLSALWNGKA